VTDRRPDRLRALRGRLEDEGLDALVVTYPANVRYLTGFSGSSSLLMVTARAVLLLTDFRYQTQAAEEVGDLARIEIHGAAFTARLLNLLPEFLQVRTLGFEAHVLTVRDAARFTDPACAWVFRPTSELVEGLRAVKDGDEVAAIAEAGKAACAALERMAGVVRVGMTELEVAALLEAELRRAGSEAHPFDTIVASGPRAALPHARTSGRRIEAGEWLLLDFGSRVDGYCADVTRTFLVGAQPDRRQREVYDVVCEAQGAALRGLRAGMTGKEGDALARDRIARAGFGEEFGHALGHGLGLEVHEAPRLSKVSEQALPAGAVVTVEPGVYLPGWGGVRIEDDVALSEQGATVLTDFPRELMVLA
jgi:Xaa-Pro aminopeptidase